MTEADRTVLGACPHDCPDTCAMVVNVSGGQVTSVQGNSDHPFTAGRLCVKVNHYEERVHSPDRVLHPMRRSGPKGSGQFERITWQEALDTIGQRWKSIIAESGPQAILPYSYLGTQGTLNGLNVGDPFFNKLGASISERTFCDSGACTGYIMTLGPTAGMDPESLQHSKYIVLWACNPMSTNTHMWPFIAEAQKRGARVVVVDPVRTRSAQAADWHIAVKPGTDSALAMGLIHVIVSEGLVDRDYVDQYTVGFDELAGRAADYTPEHVSGITGVPADDIRKLAREYARSQPSAIRIGVAIERNGNGGQAVRALSCLPALVGAWRKPGGGILQLPLWAFPIRWENLMRPEWVQPGTPVINQWLLGKVLNGQQAGAPAIRSLFVYNANPMVVAPEQDAIRRGLGREDLFTVVSEQFMTDTARYADIVLPATTQAEQFDLMFSWGHLYFTVNNPWIDPIGEAVPNTELFRRLARTMGFDDPQFSYTDEELAERAYDWSAPVLQGITLERLKREGWARLNLPAPDQYAPHAAGGFPTPSGKVELKASMAAGGNFVLPVFRQGSNEFQDGSPVDALPGWKAPAGGSGFPLALISSKSHAFLNSGYGNLRRQQSHAGDQHVLLNGRDAAARGIGDGVTVTVFNDIGAFQAVARVSEDVPVGVVQSPMGYWPAISGGASVNAVNSSRFGDLGRSPAFSNTLVDVRAGA
ncbi:MAG: molybdopterin-dependent oxidoreductase [Betaproteobacteria bacterium]